MVVEVDEEDEAGLYVLGFNFRTVGFVVVVPPLLLVLVTEDLVVVEAVLVVDVRFGLVDEATSFFTEGFFLYDGVVVDVDDDDDDDGL